MYRHWSILLAMSLLLGVVSTIAAAWACAALVNPESFEAKFTHAARADGGDDVIVSQRGFGHTRINRAQCAQLVIDEDTGQIVIARWKAGGDSSSESRAGWPLRALWCSNPGQITIVAGSAMMRSTMASSPPSSTIEGGWELPAFTGGSMGGQWRAIPLRPIWTGLAIDILFFAALWLGVIGGISAARRHLRRARGCCARCGYDLQSAGIAHARCPECGGAASAD